MMSTPFGRYETATAAFDAANAEDPRIVTWEGHSYPAEVLYAERMSRWLDRLRPDASDALRLAARAQHIRRWEIPRASYPKDRAGYLAWRTELKHFHARAAGGILAGLGYDEATVARVQSLLKKERLKQDEEAQALEDVACLVFLENTFAEFSTQHDQAKVVDIVRKTWKKMSAEGQKAALTIELPPQARALVEKALAAADAKPASLSGRG